MRESPLETGIGVLKTLLGTYVLIIAAVVYAGSRSEAPAEDPVAIEQEATESYTIVSYNGKVFAVDTKDYEAFKQSDIQETVLVDALGQETQQTMINKNDLQEIKVCNSYDEAANYISGLQNGNSLGR